MSNVIQVLDAGYGTTPDCPEAKFTPNQVVRLSRRAHLRHLPAEAVIVAIVPPWHPAEYAWADRWGKPRPLMVTRESRAVRYFVGFADNPRAYLIAERDVLRATGQTGEIYTPDEKPER